jgi:hypothetical protein
MHPDQRLPFLPALAPPVSAKAAGGAAPPDSDVPEHQRLLRRRHVARRAHRGDDLRWDSIGIGVEHEVDVVAGHLRLDVRHALDERADAEQVNDVDQPLDNRRQESVAFAEIDPI